MKITLAITLLTMTHMGMASGIYFVSGSDFRPCQVKYTLQTTEPNQTIEITPTGVKTLTVYGNEAWAGPWSVKSQGKEIGFGPYDNIRQNGTSGLTNNLDTCVGIPVGQYGCTNVAPATMTYETPNNHVVKLYSPTRNVYGLWFYSNTNITSAWIDWTDTTPKFGYRINFQNCPNLKTIWYGNPNSPEQYVTPNIVSCSALDSVFLLNPQVITEVSQYFCQNCTSLTNVTPLINATEYKAGAFQNCIKLRYFDLSKATIIGGSVLSMSSFQQAGNGLRKVRLGDGITSIKTNAFYANSSLSEIEFVCDEEDWIAKWNSNQALTKWSGQLVQGESDDLATFDPDTIATKDNIQWTGTNIPPFASIVVRRVRR